MLRVMKSPFWKKRMRMFAINSVRQVGFGIGDKLVDGVVDVICQH